MLEHLEQLNLESREGRERAADAGAKKRSPVRGDRKALLEAGDEVAEQQAADDIDRKCDPRPVAGMCRGELGQSGSKCGPKSASGKDRGQLSAASCDHLSACQG